mgnify:CR=1 FL=1
MKVTKLIIVSDYKYKMETEVYEFQFRREPLDSHDKWILERLSNSDIVMMAEVIRDGDAKPSDKMIKIWDKRLGWQNGFGHFNHSENNLHIAEAKAKDNLTEALVKEDFDASTSQE